MNGTSYITAALKKKAFFDKHKVSFFLNPPRTPEK